MWIKITIFSSEKHGAQSVTDKFNHTRYAPNTQMIVTVTLHETTSDKSLTEPKFSFN